MRYHILGLAAIAAIGFSAPAGAIPRLTVEHAEIGLGYDPDDGWDLHVHDEDNEIEYEPDEVILQGTLACQTTVPNDPNFAFLGAAGSDIWILPQVRDPSIIWLGFGAEEVPPGLFAGNEVTATLASVTGPGHFWAYEVDGFGIPTVLMDSSDGIDASDSLTIEVGEDRHVNWAFSSWGTYQIEFIGSGTLVGGGTTASDPTAYTFEILPEPGTATLAGLAALMSLRRWRSGPSSHQA
jgi:surface-anchored protein